MSNPTIFEASVLKKQIFVVACIVALFFFNLLFLKAILRDGLFTDVFVDTYLTVVMLLLDAFIVYATLHVLKHKIILEGTLFTEIKVLNTQRVNLKDYTEFKVYAHKKERKITLFNKETKSSTVINGSKNFLTIWEWMKLEIPDVTTCDDNAEVDVAKSIDTYGVASPFLVKITKVFSPIVFIAALSTLFQKGWPLVAVVVLLVAPWIAFIIFKFSHGSISFMDNDRKPGSIQAPLFLAFIIPAIYAYRHWGFQHSVEIGVYVFLEALVVGYAFLRSDRRAFKGPFNTIGMGTLSILYAYDALIILKFGLLGTMIAR
jgi:hypothetical protein